LWIVLARAFRAVESHAAASAQAHGLTLAELGVLEALYHLGPMPLCEVQRKVLVSSGGITYLVDGLEKRGLLRRATSPRDRRVRIASLTPEGEAHVRAFFPDHARALARVMEGLSDDEKGEATALLRRLGRRAAEMDPPTGGESDAR
jgi:MarR family 2-MHQ and catechol resistance regulon transcriptional repressor